MGIEDIRKLVDTVHICNDKSNQMFNLLCPNAINPCTVFDEIGGNIVDVVVSCFEYDALDFSGKYGEDVLMDDIWNMSTDEFIKKWESRFK